MNGKTFRLFISSTFSDFNEERKLLQTKVFPRLKDYCSKNGLVFQPIDLRWGVSDEAQLDQKTLELCLNEVKSSKTNPHPNFLIMASDRYGWIPLPYLINQKEFEIILENIDNREDRTSLDQWYKLDLNQLPASYILNERKDKYEKYEAWEKVETKLRSALQNAVLKLSLNNNEKKKYFTSATEAEVIEGIFKYLNKTKFQEELSKKNKELENIDYENVYAYIRNINSISDLEEKFRDSDLSEAQRFKEEIKKSILNENIYEVNTDIKNISQDEKNYSLNYEYKELESDFTDKIYSYLKSSIDKYLENIKEYTKEELEKFEQIRFKENKLKDFLEDSRVHTLNKIDEYIANNNNEALVIYGKSGLGKSSLMAKAIEKSETKYKDKKVIYRFVGSISILSSSINLVISILKECGINEEVRKVINPQTNQEESEKLEDFYLRIHEHFLKIQNQTIIFIDAIDQINNDDKFIWLPKNLPSNLKIIISALDDKNYIEDSKYFNTLKEKTNNLYALEEFEDVENLVQNMLSKYNRTISKTQMEYLLNIYKKIKTPLYLSVAVQELRHWKAEDNTQILASSQKGIIEEFRNNLTKQYHHDKEFVKRVFSYLYLSNGLSESELLEVLNTDEEFIKQIAPDTYHNNLANELPIVIWTRLHTQIQEFLKLESKDKQETMSFFHREFNDVIRNQDDIKLMHAQIIELLQKLILKYQNDEFESNRWGQLYIEHINCYEIKYQNVFSLIDLSLFENYTWEIIFIDRLQDIADNYQQQSRSLNSLSIKKFLLKIIDTTLALHNKRLDLLKKKVFMLYTISLSYETINDVKNLSKYNKFLEELLLPLYKNDEEYWFEDYLHYAIGKAIFLYKKNDNQEAILLLEKLQNLLEEKIKHTQNKFEDSLSAIYQNLAIIYEHSLDENNAIKVLTLNIKLLQSNDFCFVNREADLVNAYQTMALIYCDIKKDLNKALEYMEFANKISEGLFVKFPKIHNGTYASTQNALAHIYSFIPKYSAKALILQDSAYNLIKDEYDSSPRENIFKFLQYINNYAALLYRKDQKKSSIEYINIYRDVYRRLDDYNLESLEDVDQTYFNLTKHLYKLKKDMNVKEKKQILEELYSLSLSLYGFGSEEFENVLNEVDILNQQTTNKPGRNDPCYCKSGKKYKKCCEKITNKT